MVLMRQLGKLTQILHSISDKACKTFHKSGRKKKKRYRQPGSDNVIQETKREINSLGNKIKHNPNNNILLCVKTLKKKW